MVNRLSKNGFTLVELLVTIVLLGIVGAIVIYNMTNVQNTSKETEYERYVAAIKSAASVYADMNKNAFNDLYVNKSYVYIKVEDLVKNGSLDEKLINPYTGKTIGFDELIKANLDNNTGAIVFEYPVEEEKTETFLVGITDYVVWGEPYDCMQGAGSYELALSEENGDLIMLDSEVAIEKYHFECSMPSEFTDYVDPTTNEVVGKSIEKSGNYDITYSWITSSGTRKQATRTLKVLPKVKPTFKTNYDYNFTSNEWYTPTYNETTKEWTYLTYTPFIEGADPDTTTFKISKKSNNPNGNKVDVTNGYINKYEIYPVDDGDKTYYIETIVSGHHYKNYTYKATGEVNIKSKLVIPKSFIEGASTVWATERNFNISDTYSPVGIVKYEYRLSNSSTSLSNSLAIENTNVFTRKVGVTMKDVKIVTNNCKKEAIQYKYIFFRAINEDGYAGDWTPFTNAYLTNQLDLLIQSDSKKCSNSKTCCLASSDGSCYYSNKVKYLSYGGKKFVILERDKNGKLLVAYDGLSSNRITPTSLRSAKWEIQTCDGVFSKNYSYSSPVLQTIINEGQNFLKSLPSNYTSFIEYQTWPAGYSAYVGNIDVSLFNKYGQALYDRNPYWTTSTYSSGFDIYVDTPYAHGNYTTKYNTYFYSIDNGALSSRYAGSSAYIKPILKFKSVYTCGGDGSINNPYVVAT